MRRAVLIADRKVFLSTPSARRATAGRTRYRMEGEISIHALREEGDLPSLCAQFTFLRFLSTPSARRATCGCLCQGYVRLISIHALREEGDP